MHNFLIRLERFIAVRLLNELISIVVPPPVVQNTDETLKRIINDRVSISRYGSGEFEIMRGGGISFQERDPKLRDRLLQIIKSNETNHIVGIPDVFQNTVRFTDDANKFWTGYVNYNRNTIYKMLNMKKTYYDSLMTRLYMDYKDKTVAEQRFNTIKNIWDKREIVIIEGTGSRLGVGNDLFQTAKSIERISCPSENAFAAYEDILAEAKRHEKTKLILIALGPTATVLAYDLALCGYQALDIGHVDIEYEWFIHQSAEKSAVKNKYVNEVLGGAVFDDTGDDEYLAQVVAKISLYESVWSTITKVPNV